MFSKFRTFLSLPGRHKVIFLKIALIVPLVEIGVKTLKFKRTFNILRSLASRKSKHPENEQNLVYSHIDQAYIYHKQFFSFGNCLARCLTIWFLLKREGIETEIKFGMKKETEKLLAHSWIEYEGQALIRKSEIDENYIPFSESILTEVSK